MCGRVDFGSEGIVVACNVGSAAAGYYSLCGWRSNTSIIAARPLKGTGLGIKGISLIVRCFSELGVDYITDQGEEHQRAWEAELLASSGTVTLVDAAA